LYGTIESRNDFVVYLDGELDHCRAEALRDQVDKTLENVSCKRVIFDMSQVTFMDSSGVGFLIGRYKKLIPKGCIVALRGATDAVDRILDISGIYKIIRLCNEKESKAG